MDRDVVERARSGDQEAFADLVYQVSDTLLGIARRILRDPTLAEDVLQNALLTIWRKLPHLRDAEHFEGWAFRILVHACYEDAPRNRRGHRPFACFRPTSRVTRTTSRPSPTATSWSRPSASSHSTIARSSCCTTTWVCPSWWWPNARHPGRDGQIAVALRDPGVAGYVRGGAGVRGRNPTGAIGMNSDLDFETTTADWLNAGSDPTPPHLIEAVLLAARNTPQERDLRDPWRAPIVNKFTTFGFGAGAMIVVAFVVAVQLFGSPSSGGSGGEPTPTPEATATEPSPSPSVSWRPLPAAECAELDAGTYRAAIEAISVTLSVPMGWKGSSDLDRFALNSRHSCLFTGGVTLDVSLVSHVYSSACDERAAAVKTDTPAAVTAALAAQTGHRTTGPRDTSIAGYPATRFEFSIPAGETTCNRGPLWPAPGGGRGPTMYRFDGSGSLVTVLVVDVDGLALGIAIDTGVPDDPADIAELDAIVDSLRIEP